MIDVLSRAIDLRKRATVDVALAASAALIQVMDDHGWSEITVDAEERSQITHISTADGQVVRQPVSVPGWEG